MSNSSSESTAPTGIKLIDGPLNMILYLFIAGAFFLGSMYAYVMFVHPAIDGTTFTFAVWFCVSIYIAGKMA